MTNQQRIRLAAVIVPIQIVLAMLARKDLARRTEAEVRGPKAFWSVFVLLNPGNSVLYWVFGRRAPSASNA